MVRIANVEMSAKKPLWNALRDIYGIGKSSSMKICKKIDVDPSLKINQLDGVVIDKIRNIIKQDYLVEAELKKNVYLSIKRLISISSYRGIRLSRGYKIHGGKQKAKYRIAGLDLSRKNVKN